LFQTDKEEELKFYHKCKKLKFTSLINLNIKENTVDIKELNNAINGKI